MDALVICVLAHGRCSRALLSSGFPDGSGEKSSIMSALGPARPGVKHPIPSLAETAPALRSFLERPVEGFLVLCLQRLGLNRLK